MLIHVPRPSIIAFLVCALAFIPIAHADEQPTQRFDVGARGGLIVSSGFPLSLGMLVGGDMTYRMTPALRAGGYLEWATVSSGISRESQLAHHGHFEAVRFGARGQAHLRPLEVIDPWVGASVGLSDTTAVKLGDPAADVVPGRWGADLGLDLGLDFHIGETFTIGIVFAVVIPLGNDRVPRPGAGSVGVYFSGWVTPIPFPMLRVGAAF